MFNKIMFIIVPIFLVLGISIIVVKNKQNNKIMKDTLSFRFFFTQGYMMNADTVYEYSFKNDKYIMTIKPYLVDSEKASSFEVDKKVIKEIEDVFNKYKVIKWDGFNKSNNYVLDGDSFSFSVRGNDFSISASGYMKWPNNYGNVKSEISQIFERELEKNK